MTHPLFNRRGALGALGSLAAALLAPFWGLDAAIVEQANGRRSYAVRPVTPQNITEQQQQIADAFLAEKLLPRRVNAVDVARFKPQG